MSVGSSDSTRHHLSALVGEPSASVRDQRDVVITELAAVFNMDCGQLRDLWETFISSVVSASLTAPSTSALSAGTAAAASGRELSTSLQVLQELRRLAMSLLQLHATAEGVHEDLVIAGFGRIAHSSNEFMLKFSRGYLDAEVENQARLRTERDAFVWSALSGTVGEGGDPGGLARYGLVDSGPYWVFRYAVASGTPIYELEEVLSGAGDPAQRFGLSTVIDGEICGLSTQLPEFPAAGVGGFAGPTTFAEVPVAFRRATRALRIAQRSSRMGWSDLETLTLTATAFTDDDIARHLFRRYGEPLAELGEYGLALWQTAREYVRHDCNLDEAAAALQMHANGVRYRLRKFEESLGIALSDTESIAEIWWLTELYDQDLNNIGDTDPLSLP